MKILLNECVTKHLKPHLRPHEVLTVKEMGWGGVKNGKLLALCVEDNFEILLSIDKNLEHQQNLSKFPVSIIIFNSSSSKIEELIKYIPTFTEKIAEFKKYAAYVINL